jgi:sigma-B regulation protein RsbU (phosphoserine phosphatase)
LLVKLVIAEDDANSMRLMKAILVDCPLEIVTAADGEDALRSIERDAAIVIILDWMVPGPTGLEICQRIRQRNMKERPYLVMVTVRDSDDDVVAAFAAGADDYITKPIRTEQLRGRVTAGMRLVLREHALVQEQEALRAALGRLHDLPALVPICSYCKRVGDRDDTWLSADRYLTLHTGAQFTHGICPTCAPRLMEPRDPQRGGAPADLAPGVPGLAAGVNDKES